MARSVRHAKLDSRTARRGLKAGRQPHWQALAPNLHLGYQRKPRKRGEAEEAGRWMLRRYLGGGNSYRVTALGLSDDSLDANGTTILDHAQALAKAQAMIATPSGGKIERITVRQAVTLYCDYKRSLDQPFADAQARAEVHILPALGDLVLSELTAERLRRWLSETATLPAQRRPKKGKPQFAPEPTDDEGRRKRKATANRVLTLLKAILNHAYDEGHVAHRDAWGRKLKPYPDVDMARVRYLSVAEARRLVNACDAEFRPLVQGALETGARYSELARLEVADFNPDAGTLAIRKSKSGKARHIVMTDEGTAFFKTQCAGRAGAEPIFTHLYKDPVYRRRVLYQKTEKLVPWGKSEQIERMKKANERAKLTPPIGFHGLRHTWASLAVMSGMPLMVVAKNLGHKDTSMVEQVYGHLAPSYVQEAIRAHAPRYGIKPEKSNVKPLR